jgi:hypothetical protein
MQHLAFLACSLLPKVQDLLLVGDVSSADDEESSLSSLNRAAPSSSSRVLHFFLTRRLGCINACCLGQAGIRPHVIATGIAATLLRV